MVKISDVSKAECLKMQESYQKTLKLYKDEIDNIEKELLKKNNEFEIKEDKLKLAILYIKTTSYLCAICSISNNYLKSKPEAVLNEGRKNIITAIVLLEAVFSNQIDRELLHNEDVHEYFSDKITDEWKYKFISSFGYTITYLKYIYGDDSKWKWNFIEISTRFSIIIKNMINYKTYLRDLNPSIKWYEYRVKLMKLNKKLLMKSSESYRKKYELVDKMPTDMQMAINISSVLRKIHMYLNEIDEANKQKKTSELWLKKLNEDKANK